MNLDLSARVRQSWDAVLAWDESTPIYRPEFNEHKDRLSRAFDDGGSSVSRVCTRPELPRDHHGNLRSGFYYDLIFRRPPLITLPKSKVPGELARHSPAPDEKVVHDWWVDYYQTWMPVAEKLVMMKAKAIPGRRPSPQQIAKEQLRSSPASRAGRDQIARVIASVTQEWRREEIERVVAHIRGVVEKYNAGKLPGEQPNEFWRREFKCREVDRPREPWSVAQSQHEAYSQLVSAANEQAALTRACLGDPNYPRKAAEAHAQAVVDTFTGKMQDKLAFAIPTLMSIEARHVSRAAATLACTLAVTLSSGAKFEVRNQLVGSYSTGGVHFYRFPSTFHAVELPGHAGRIAMASEDEMKALFAPGTAILPSDEALKERLEVQAKARLRS